MSQPRTSPLSPRPIHTCHHTHPPTPAPSPPLCTFCPLPLLPRHAFLLILPCEHFRFHPHCFVARVGVGECPVPGCGRRIRKVYIQAGVSRVAGMLLSWRGFNRQYVNAVWRAERREGGEDVRRAVVWWWEVREWAAWDVLWRDVFRTGWESG